MDRNEDSILYELLVYSEWKQDPEQTLSNASLPNPKKSLFRRLLSLFNPKLTIPELIYEQVGCRFPWQFCVGEGGKAIAILQDSSLEIRSSKDEYCSIVGKASVASDDWPHWRHMAWSADCSFLAVANSNGVVNFYDLLACKIFEIPPDCKAPLGSICKEIQHAIAGIIFIENSVKEHKWSSEVLLIDYNGNLRSFLISPTEGYKLKHTFSFSSYYSGISTVSLHPSHPVLVVSGNGNKEFGSSVIQENGCSVGLSTWRVLNDPPYFKLSENSNETSNSKQWLGWSGKTVGVIFKTSISSSGSLIACLHSCGTISIWRMPSLQLVNIWKLMDQPDYNIPNPLLTDKNCYRGVNLKKMSPNSPIDINWWSDEAIILSRYSGAISVNSVKDLKNLLGNNPEFLSGQPQVSSLLFNKGFITLECESFINIKKKTRDPSDELDNELYSTDILDISDTQNEDYFLEYIINMIKYSLYVVTDIDKFRPALPPLKSLNRTYRMLCLKSSTPEELYSRKIDAGDYEEALSLANTYNLDTDLVYKRQWQNSKVCKQSISDYLSKIKKRWWVLQQCVERVADSIESTRELLEFGKKITGLNVFLNEEKCDISNIAELDEENEQDKNIEEILQSFDYIAMNADQKELIRYRILIMKYLDQLFIYELMCYNDGEYDSRAYNEFRTSSTLFSAVKLARKGACNSLLMLLAYHLNELEDHIFPLISNLPETLDPSEFWNLLPQCDSEGRMVNLEPKGIRARDWCESEYLRYIYDLHLDPEMDSPDWLYLELRDLSLYRGKLTPTQITQWYITRAREIEDQTGIVDNALKLINIAIQKNVLNLNELHFDLETLDCLIYEVRVDNVSLSDLQQSTKLERGIWLMSKATPETFINNLSNLFLKYIHKSHNEQDDVYKMELLQEYIVHLSKNNLKWAFVYFEYLKNSSQPNGIATKLDLKLEEKINLLVKCIYINTAEDLEQIELAGQILECLPEIDEEHPMAKRLADLERELQCSKLLHIRGIPQSPKVLHELRNNVPRAKELLNQLARSVLRLPPSEIEWNDLLTDLINIKDTMFCSVDIEQVFEIYVTTLLLCGQKLDIESAAEVMHCSAESCRNKDQSSYKSTKISYERSVQIVLEAAREYFDSSRSLDDKNMELSKTCLLLIQDEHEEIQEELDLIAAIKILQDFRIPILPIQVRLCPDRLSLVESCLNSAENRSNTIKYPQYIVHNYSIDNSVLELAKRLHIYGNNEKKREGAVLEMLTKDALQKCSWNLCWSYCQRIINGEHGAHWRVVTELARQGDSLVTSIRTEALDFALLYCDAQDIEELLNIRKEIEIKELKAELDYLTAKTINEQKARTESGSENETSPTILTDENFDPFASSLSTVKELPGNISKVIKMFNPTDILKDSTLHLMSHILDEGVLKLKESDETQTSVCNRFDVQRYPCFYLSLHNDCLPSNYYSSYDRFSSVEIASKELQICRILLKLVTLEHDASEIPSMDQVIIQYATHTLPEDITFGLALLFLLKDPCEAKTVFDSFPVTLASLRACIYYIALQIVNRSPEYSTNKEILTYTPEELLKIALETESLDQNEKLLLLLQEYRTKLQDLSQAEELQTLGCGVDTQRFTNDESYRSDSILGLAMSPHIERYNLALKLGKRHKINLSSIAFEHVSGLLQSTEVPLDTLKQRLDNKELLSSLKEQPEETCKRLLKEVFPTMDGKQHEMLMLYFELMDKINSDYIIHGLLSKEHIKLLKKVKVSCPVLDYTLLLSPPDNFISQITTNITQDDLPVLCKFLKTLPTQLSAQCHYTQSLLYKEWCMKFMTQIPIHSSAQEYNSCWHSIIPLFSKINAEDFQMFVCHITLNPKSVNRIDIATRLLILKEAITYCNERSKQDRIEGWSYTHSEFLKWEIVLKALRSESWQSLLLYGEEIFEVIKIVQASCTDQELLASAFVRLLKIQEIPLDDIFKAMKEIPDSPTFYTIIKFLINLTDEMAENSENYLENLTLVISRLENFLSCDMSSLPKEEVSFGSGDWDNEWNIDDEIEDEDTNKTNALSDIEKNELSDILLRICGDSKIPSSLRLRIMKILQNFNISSGAEFSTVMLYQHTQATISSAWGDQQTNNDVMEFIADMDLSTEQGRFKVFEQLLNNTKDWTHIECLNDLLAYWPKFVMAEFMDYESPWYRLLKTILVLNSPQNINNIYPVLLKISECGNLSDSIILDLHKEHKDNISDRMAVLFDLVFSENTASNNLKSHAVDIINRIDEPLEEIILNLISSKHLVSQIVGSKSYKSILEHSLMAKTAHTSDNASQMVDPEVIVQDLLNSKLVAEAGSFSLTSIGTPDSLKTFTSALKWAKRLYNDEEE